MRARCARSWRRRASHRPFASRLTPMPIYRASRLQISSTRQRAENGPDRGEQRMIPVYSTWLAAHGRLWYEDGWYRLAWVVWPQALGVVMIMLLWAMPPSARNVPWAKPIDGAARAQQLQALRDT